MKLSTEQIERYRDDAIVVLKTSESFSDEYAAARAITELSTALLIKNAPLRHANPCSFCGKIPPSSQIIVAGSPGVFICSDCVVECTRILFSGYKRHLENAENNPGEQNGHVA